ncbi:hypothetical protein WJ45_20065 [Burkholderia ubonensis]|nr:hypothetical protein WJ45_20065 [Burkholderia ubonensis]KVQ44346.1 hypothetical protein WK04_15570 [Burkholderia ubonensis]
MHLKSGQPQDKLFANGNMQIGVVVSITAIDDSGQQVILSDDQLNSIQLIDYSTYQVLSGGWAYSSQENSYNHSFPGEIVSGASDPSARQDRTDDRVSDGQPQIKVYWVTTTSVESIQIGAQVTLNGTTYSTHSTGFDSHVGANGQQPVTYSVSSLKVEVDENVPWGHYSVEVMGQEGQENWEQHNYYIYPTNGINIEDYSVWNTFNNDDHEDLDFRQFTYLTNNDNLKLWYLWGTLQEGREVGRSDITWGDGPFSCTLHPRANINTSPRANAITVTGMSFGWPSYAHWGPEGYYNPYFSFRDVYGNTSGPIRIIIESDHMSFHLEDD